ncbi:hypothetical protein [Sandaracinobacteroides hominis]|uniref:hypothetical protein n=1 Tax=Sandaracinobacteroides hominis TaxID=2780086 RepID=UPI0018F37045|nr:hypothetical protein [Sandaracinobacteroides hominis]
MSRILTRLLAFAEIERKAARQRLAEALSKRQAAETQARRAELLILEGGASTGTTDPSRLSAAASLRALLQQAQDAASHRAGTASEAAGTARAALLAAEARHGRLQQMQADARRLQERQAEVKAADDRPHRARNSR